MEEQGRRRRRAPPLADIREEDALLGLAAAAVDAAIAAAADQVREEEELDVEGGGDDDNDDEDNDDDDDDDDEHAEAGPDGRDTRNIAVLLFLYMLQGIPLGLSAAIPIYILNRGVDYRSQAEFSITQWPFSLKLLWAPIVDSVFVSWIGRRKSWLIPTQYLLGLFMLFLSKNVESWMGSVDPPVSPDVNNLTLYFFILNFLAATQDIVVDGWAITMLRRNNIGHASTCNSVGQTTGYFLGYVVFLALESPSFCNRYLRFTPEPVGVITFAGFLYFWGISFLISTTLIAVFQKEVDPADQLARRLRRPRIGIVESYELLWRIVQLPAVKWLILVLITSKIGYTACDAITPLKLVEKGFSKETLAGMAIPMVPLQLALPFFVSKFLVGPRPMELYLKTVPYRLFLSIAVVLFVWKADFMLSRQGWFPTLFAAIILLLYCLIQVALYTMFVSVMAFFARISDPAVGGTYMTLLNTVNNLAGHWTSTAALGLVDYLTFESCYIDFEDNKVCHYFDGYYIESFICFLGGLWWLNWARGVLRDLTALPVRDWHVVQRPLAFRVR